MTATSFRLTRPLREEVAREGRSFLRKHPGAMNDEVADHMVGVMLGDEEHYGTEGFEAIEISDYAYALANFLTGGRGAY